MGRGETRVAGGKEQSMKRILIGLSVVGAVLVPVAAGAYSYAGYRWGGSFPQVPVDTRGLAITAWRSAANDAMASWNNAGAKFRIYSQDGATNTMSYYYQVSSVLANAPTWRKYGFWGDVVRGEVRVNNYHNFNPPYTSGTWYDLRSVLRHEFGHWIVLWHVTNPGALMYHSVAPGQVKHVSSDEVAAVRNVYGIR